jgi:hypothetical protein
VQNQTGGVSLGVAANDQDFLTQVRQGCQGILGCGRFTDATFAVEGDLPKFCHFSTPIKEKVKNQACVAATRSAFVPVGLILLGSRRPDWCPRSLPIAASVPCPFWRFVGCFFGGLPQ